MKAILSKIFVSVVDRSSSVLLDNPYLFNYTRYFLAGNQTDIKAFIKKYLDKYKVNSVADICSGTGDFAILTPKNATYTGWDLNDEFVQYARSRYRGHKNKKFIKADILDVKKTQGQKYDAVLLISTIHHFSDEELKVILPAVKKMTRKLVIIADIIPDPPHALQKFFAKIDRGKYVRPANRKLSILRKYFKVVHTQPIPTRSAVQFGIICVV